MRKQPKTSKRSCVAILGVAPLLLLGTGLRAQSQAAAGNRTFQDDDTTRKELAQFDQFLDSHQEIAEQLRKDPSLADKEQFLKTHPALQTYLQQQPAIRQDLKQNPDAFMRQEANFDRNDVKLDYDARRAHQEEFNRFLDGHREIAEQVRKDPSLADKDQFLKSHPALQSFLQSRPEIRQDLRQDPKAFLQQEDASDRQRSTFGRDGGFDSRRDADKDSRDFDKTKDDDHTHDFDKNKAGRQFGKPAGVTGTSDDNPSGKPPATDPTATSGAASTTAPVPAPTKSGTKQ